MFCCDCDCINFIIFALDLHIGMRKEPSATVLVDFRDKIYLFIKYVLENKVLGVIILCLFVCLFVCLFWGEGRGGVLGGRQPFVLTHT